jgi:hypothetical protein
MKIKVIAENLDLDWVSAAAAEASAIDLAASGIPAPFQPGYTVVAVIQVGIIAGSSSTPPEVALEGREETSDSWTELAESTQLGFVMKEVTLPRYVRVRTDEVTASDGFANVYLLGN